MRQDRRPLIHLGAVLRARRTELGLTQEQVANRIGTATNYVGMLERGERNATFLVLLRLSEALDRDLSDVVREAQAAIRVDRELAGEG